MQVLQLFARYWPELVGDFQQTYGLDLAEFWSGGLSESRVWMLICQLPPGSRIWRMMGGSMAWSELEHAIHGEGWRIASYTAGKRLDPPEPPKPGWHEEQEAQRRSKEHHMAAFVEKFGV